VSGSKAPAPNYLTPAGYTALRAEYDQLFQVERPKTVEIVSWAAGNGDRSENGDYIYGRKRLREIDGRLNRLSRKLKAAKIVDPAQQPDQSRIFFGAIVTIADEQDNHREVMLVGNDEADARRGRIGWGSPLARALRGASVGDVRTVRLPGGTKEWEVIAIRYSAAPSGSAPAPAAAAPSPAGE
jgi:transcription elongation factor GreB